MKLVKAIVDCVSFDNTKIIQEVTDWVIDFVEEPQDEYGGFPPCPFSKKFRKMGLVDILVNTADSLYDFLEKTIHSYCFDKQLYIIVEWDLNKYPESEVYIIRNKLKPIAEEAGLEIMVAHPEDELNFHNGLKMSHEKYILILIQPYEILLKYRKKAYEMGYYNTWTKERIEDVVENKWNDIFK